MRAPVPAAFPADETFFNLQSGIIPKAIALLNHTARSDIEKIVTEIHKIETAIEPRFQEHFVNASAIPNSVEKFPILETHVNLPLINFNMGNSKEGTRRRRRN